MLQDVNTSISNTNDRIDSTNVQVASNKDRLDILEGSIGEPSTQTVTGIATLDTNGKIPAEQLPNSVMDYKGQWNPSTNIPELEDGVGDAGDVYKCSADGIHTFDTNPIQFYEGDLVIYNGTHWERSSGGNVLSVAGKTGVVTLDSSDISAGNNQTVADKITKYDRVPEPQLNNTYLRAKITQASPAFHWEGVVAEAPDGNKYYFQNVVNEDYPETGVLTLVTAPTIPLGTTETKGTEIEAGTSTFIDTITEHLYFYEGSGINEVAGIESDSVVYALGENGYPVSLDTSHIPDNVIELYDPSNTGKFYSVVYDKPAVQAGTTFEWASGGGNGVAFIGTRAQYETAKLIPEGNDGFIPSGSMVIITDEDDNVEGTEV